MKIFLKVLFLGGGLIAAIILLAQYMHDPASISKLVAHIVPNSDSGEPASKFVDEQTGLPTNFPSPPRTLVNDSVPDTIAAAAKDGWIPCPEKTCLNFSIPGWHHQHIEGFPEDYIWMVYRYSEGWQAFSQNHIGHIIRPYPNRNAQDLGPCKTCHGKGWVRKDPEADKALEKAAEKGKH